MNTDTAIDLTRGDKSRLLLRSETEQLLGFCFAVANEVGHGFAEKIYENALVVLLKEHRVPFRQQARFPVLFRDVPVGEFIPDLIAFESVILEAKVIDRISDHERGQMLNYLRVSKLRVGLIVNFKHARLDWERIVL